MVRSSDVSVYGPLPIDSVFSACSAVSAVAASAASVAPAALALTLFRMPSEGLASLPRTAESTVADSTTTVVASGAVTVRPSIRNDGLPLTLATRFSENTTSAEVTGVPSVNFAAGFRVNV